MGHDLRCLHLDLPLLLLSRMVMEAMPLFLSNSKAMLVDPWAISILPCII